MTDLAEEGELPRTYLPARWRTLALATLRFVPPIISVVCAILVGYFTYATAYRRPPADISALAVSILKSSDASPEMRDWAADALGLQTDIPMPAKSIRPN
ncbi:hypothetical protein MesoLj113c_15760 [Mesorhizobium sp. 113-3-9]|nr:hypothetical protein MesoLj113c_15760 [Mesorhizobium sp. 113-3-9]